LVAIATPVFPSQVLFAFLKISLFSVFFVVEILAFKRLSHILKISTIKVLNVNIFKRNFLVCLCMVILCMSITIINFIIKSEMSKILGSIFFFFLLCMSVFANEDIKIISRSEW
jgi:hypothetical protein